MKKTYLYIMFLVIAMTALIPFSVVFAQEGNPPTTPPVSVGVDVISGIANLLTASDLKRVGIVVFLVFGNWLAAVLVSIAHGTFDAKKLPIFFTQTVLPFIGGFILFEAAMHILSPSVILESFGKYFSDQFSSGFDASFLWVTFGSILIATGRSFVGNLMALFSVISDNAKKLSALSIPKKADG